MAHPLYSTAGATARPRVVIARVLAPLAEPALGLLKTIRDAWRPALWRLPSTQPRTWALRCSNPSPTVRPATRRRECGLLSGTAALKGSLDFRQYLISQGVPP